jgi:PTH2 family peptidyl-tRNA hydrolase
VFLVREDLKLSTGKTAAQVAHAAVGKCYFNYSGLVNKINKRGSKYYKSALNYWNDFGAKKIVLKVNNLETIERVQKACRNLKIPCSMISDAGRTEVEPGTVTVLGVGPEVSDKLNKITGEFRLMK